MNQEEFKPLEAEYLLYHYDRINRKKYLILISKSQIQIFDLLFKQIHTLKVNQEIKTCAAYEEGLLYAVCLDQERRLNLKIF